MARRINLAQWITSVVTDPNKTNAKGEKIKCSKLGMIHMQAGQEKGEVYSLDILNKQVDAKEIADLFHGKAEAQSQEYTGRQVFKMIAFYEDSPEPQASFNIAVAGRTDYDGETEPPTKEGTTAQQMRHYEHGMGMVLGQHRHMHEVQNSMISDLVRANRGLMNDVTNLFRTAQEMMVTLAKTEHDKTMEELKFRRDTEERAWLRKMAPVIANTLTGGALLDKGTEDTAIVEAFAEAMDPQKLDMLFKMGLLPEDQRTFITSRLKRYELEKQAKQQQELDGETKLFPAAKDPIADARGDVQGDN